MRKYCSKECQKGHWPIHKKACQSPLAQAKWLPGFVIEGRSSIHSGFEKLCLPRNLSWGNIPAFDCLKLGVNEGDDWNKDLDLCFVSKFY